MRVRLLSLALLCAAGLWGTASAEDRLTLIDAGQLRQELDGLQGRVVLVNFWATWCRPCLEEIPALLRLQDQLQSEGFSLVAVSLDQAESAETLVRPFMLKWFPGFDSYLSIEREMDDMVSVIDPAWNEILPSSYLLTRDGQPIERIQGAQTEAQFADRIRALLNP